MKLHPQGSEWRKWDLHVHLPGTKLADRYQSVDGRPDWDRFADIIEASDVAVVGITDYFSVADIFKFIEFFKGRFPDSTKLLLPNVEFRLNESVNKAGDLVHVHVIIRDTVDAAKAANFLSKIATRTSDTGDRDVYCDELSTKKQFESATVTVDALKGAAKTTFGRGVDLSDYLILLVPANNDGIRATANARKQAIADDIDKSVNAIFGASQNRHYFLDEKRRTDGKPIIKKPVFGGCDAHSFEDLEAWLGRDIVANETHQDITWVKADPTYAGLLQTLIEPEDRVALQSVKPDAKDAYKVIREVRFSGSKDFPEVICFNSNLNAIIGSRSSGKSALLAHIAYAVDPSYTVRQQVKATNQKEAEVGPAAGKRWRDVANTTCEVVWEGGEDGPSGNVIYIPQNWLYVISDDAAEVTAKIQPALVASDPKFALEHDRLLAAVDGANQKIGAVVDRWFVLSSERTDAKKQQRLLGDKAAIEQQRDELQDKIKKAREQYKLSETDVADYQAVVKKSSELEREIAELARQRDTLDPYVIQSGKKFVASPGSVTADIQLEPDINELPTELVKKIQPLVTAAEKALTTQVESELASHREGVETLHGQKSDERQKLLAENQKLIERTKGNKTIGVLVDRHAAQVEILAQIAQYEKDLAEYDKKIADEEKTLVALLEQRGGLYSEISTNFTSTTRTLDDLTFGIELDVSPDQVQQLSAAFNKNELGSYVTKDIDGNATVNFRSAQAEPATFLKELRDGTQKLNQGYDRAETAKKALQLSNEVRFSATLDADVIGGFGRPTMTPGKQALFALTLILNEAQESWPLLIDQPEDDLDSRSIYRAIVPYLIARKKERQIILVTHNANLVIGADAEEVLIANRHGVDSKNQQSRTFDYLTGSLEHSETKHANNHALHTMGIREHACEILDGGEEAFHKRAEKYKI